MSNVRYIGFYLDLVATQENIALLYHLAMKAKTVRDFDSRHYSEVCSYRMFPFTQTNLISKNLYATSELAQHLIKAWAKSHNWTVESYPGKVKLPGDILRPLANAETANEVCTFHTWLIYVLRST